MRVLFSSTRGSGHLHPLLPYAHALVRQGHEVCVAAPESARATLDKAQLVHAPFDHPGDALLAPIWARFRGASAAETLAIAVGEIFAGANARAALPKLRELMRSFRPDLVVRESAELASMVAAAEAGIVQARVPVHMESFEAECFTPHAIAPIDSLRQSVGLAPDDGDLLRAAPIFSAFPASLDGFASGTQVFRSRDAVAPAQHAAAKPDWAPKDGQAFVYITFGTLAGTIPEALALYRAALDAVSNIPVQALLTTGPDFKVEALSNVPANVTVRTWVPQAEVLAHASAVICHGGSGTMVGSLGAGVPMVVAPFGADQPHNARRVEAVDAGIAVMKPDAASLRAALERALSEPTLRAGARRLADEIASLPTVEDAAQALVALV